MNDMTQDDSWKGEHLIRGIKPAFGRPGAVTFYDLREAQRRGLSAVELANELEVDMRTVHQASSRHRIFLEHHRRKRKSA